MPPPRVVKGSRKVHAYADAVRTVRALEQAVKDDGQDRAQAIKDAKAEVQIRLRVLTGGQLGAVRRELASDQPTKSADRP
jgi:hypothetical protein